MADHYEFVILHDFPQPEYEKGWRECVSHADFPTHYCSPEFFREPFFENKRPFVVLALSDSGISGVLTGVHQGEQVISGGAQRPQICLAVMAERDPVTDALVRGLLAEAGTASLIEVHTWSKYRPFLDSGFRARTQQGSVMLDLTMGAEPLMKQFSSTRRNYIRQSIRKGVEVFQAQAPEDFSAYLDIYLSWCRRKGFQPMALDEFYRAMSLRDNRRLFLARQAGKIVAGTVVRFYPGGIMEYSANSSLPECLPLRANDLLSWRAIEWAVGIGMSRYSLGGASQFHKHFGGEIVPTYRYQLDRTWLRRYYLRESIQNWRRVIAHQLPHPVKNAVRRIMKKNQE